MKLASFTLIALLTSAHAHAWDCNYWSQSSNPSVECYKAPAPQARQIAKGGQAKAKSKSTAAANSESSSQAAASADNAGVTTLFESREVRQTPSAFSGYVEPTIPCANARNGGASSPIAGLSLGFSTKDKECDLRETARLFYEMGQPELAVALLCKSTAAQALGNICKYSAPIAPEYPPGEREHRMQSRGFPGGK